MPSPGIKLDITDMLNKNVLVIPQITDYNLLLQSLPTSVFIVTGDGINIISETRDISPSSIHCLELSPVTNPKVLLHRSAIEMTIINAIMSENILSTLCTTDAS